MSIYLRVGLFRMFLRYVERSLGKEFYHEQGIITAVWLPVILAVRDAAELIKRAADQLDGPAKAAITTLADRVINRLKKAYEILDEDWPPLPAHLRPERDRERWDHDVAVQRTHAALKCLTSARLRVRVWQQQVLWAWNQTSPDPNWETFAARWKNSGVRRALLALPYADLSAVPFNPWKDVDKGLEDLVKVLAQEGDVEKCVVSRSCLHALLRAYSIDPRGWSPHVMSRLIVLHRQLLATMHPGEELALAVERRLEFLVRFSDDSTFRQAGIDPLKKSPLGQDTAENKCGETTADLYDHAVDALLAGRHARQPADWPYISLDQCWTALAQACRAHPTADSKAREVVAAILFMELIAEKVDLWRRMTNTSRLYLKRNKLLMDLKRAIEPAASGDERDEGVSVRPWADRVFATLCEVNKYPVPFRAWYQSDYIAFKPAPVRDATLAPSKPSVPDGPTAQILPGRYVAVLAELFARLVGEGREHGHEGSAAEWPRPLCEISSAGNRIALAFTVPKSSPLGGTQAGDLELVALCQFLKTFGFDLGVEPEPATGVVHSLSLSLPGARDTGPVTVLECSN